ncbi:MAG: 30S ribosomal protein S20 [Thiogranum sp.]|nr:30S ribosomal protein S20 [Thiogranum sp.]
MANSAQARKRARQSERSRQRNSSQRSMLRTHIKNVVKAIASGDKAAAQTAYDKAVPVIDKSAGKGLIHKNKASRHKSRLAQHVRTLEG